MICIIKISGVFLGTIACLGCKDLVGFSRAISIGTVVALGISSALTKYFKNAMMAEL
jgi:hypothetical protein